MAIKTPDNPALSQIVIHGTLHASAMIFTPYCWSGLSNLTLLSNLLAYNKADPPPTTIPSAAAALVAHNASFILSFSSLTSVSEAPPTFNTATPPVNFPNLSSSFSLS